MRAKPAAHAGSGRFRLEHPPHPGLRPTFSPGGEKDTQTARLLAISPASRTAAIRLSARATPFPAMSNPVP